MMNLREAVLARHSVRSYEKKPIAPETAAQLEAYIAELNDESGLHMQLVMNHGKPFAGLLSLVGWLAGVENYLAIAGSKDDPGLAEKCGYYGEKFVLRAQQLGLNTCWVAGTYNKAKCTPELNPGEKLVLVIALGYGKNQGKARKSKTLEAVCEAQGEMPAWFRQGAEFALLAPTAVNQQAFRLKLVGENGVRAEALKGPFADIDLGIVKYHFEIGAGEGDWKWMD